MRRVLFLLEAFFNDVLEFVVVENLATVKLDLFGLVLDLSLIVLFDLGTHEGFGEHGHRATLFWSLAVVDNLDACESNRRALRLPLGAWLSFAAWAAATRSVFVIPAEEEGRRIHL